jgi:hypothetical protein
MIKKAGLFILAILLFLVLMSPGLAQAQNELRIVASSVEPEFPLILRFNLSAESDVSITDIRLHYTVERESFAQVTSEVYMDFVPDRSVDVQWAWDMRKTGGLPSGTVVEYWWTVEDIQGDKVTTVPVRVRFDDALTEDTGAYLKKPVKMYIYANPSDLQRAMVFPQEWTGGVTFTRYGVVAIGIAPNNLDWGKRAITHELTHLVVHQMTLNPYGDLPTWLEEGLATYAEGELDATLTSALERGIAQGALFSVRSLASPFSVEPAKARLSYAQSYSLVEFLINSYGQNKMFELLDTFSQGSSYDEALGQVYGFDMDALNTLWLDYIGQP